MNPGSAEEIGNWIVAKTHSSESDRRVAAILDSITDGIVGVSFDWRYTYANESAARFLRKPKEQLIGEDVFRAFPEAKGTVFEENFRKTLEERVPVSFEAFYESLNSWFECRCYPSTEGISVLFTDTTERKRQEEERGAYQEMVRSANSAIIRWKRDGTITFFNEFAQELFGYSNEEIIGKHVSVLIPEIESSGAELTSLVEDIVSHPDLYINNANENVTRDGRRIWMTWTNKALFDQTGQVAEILAVGSDITKGKMIEETLVRQKALLSGIARILHEALACQTEEELGEVCLHVAEEITESGFGFIGENKDQHLEEIAISNPGWDACAELYPHGYRKPPGKFELNGIYGRVLLDGKSFFTNDPTRHPDLVGLPVGHPPLESFLGVPLIHQGRTFGMIALANRPSGYSSSEQESVEELAPVIVEAFMRKRAEQALRESEERFRRLFENDLTGDFLCTPEGQILLCNPAFATIFGFSSPDEVLGTNFLDLYVDLGERESMLESLKQQGKLFRYETWGKRKDGELIYVIENIVGHFNDRGELFEIQGYIFDDTERKKAEEALTKAEKKYRELVQYAPAGIYEIDFRTRRFTSVNDAMCQMAGYSREELLAMDGFDLLDEASQALFQSRITRWLRGEEPDRGVEYSVRAKDGHTLDVILNVSFTRDEKGKPLGATVIGHDITERKQMEEELRKSRDELERRVQERTAELQQANEQLKEENQERLRTEELLRLEESRLEALLQLSQMGKASLKEITNFTLDQAIMLTESEIGFVGFLNEDETVYTLHAVSKDVVKECKVTGDLLQWHVVDAGIWASAIRERKTLFVNDYSKPHPEKKGLPPGHPHVERFMVVPIFNDKRIVALAGVGNKPSDYDDSDERQIVLLLNAMWDYGQKMRSREELENAYQNLEKSNSELAEYNRQLNALNQELQDFAFIASHDLNEPLRKIRAFGDMVTKRLADFKDEASKDYLKRMQSAAARMQTLLDSLLSYSRVTTKAEPMKKTDLRRSVKEALSNLEISIGEKNADVEIGDLPTIKADAVQMTQLFQNLIGNALKFHREGEAPRVKIHAKEVGDAFELYVEDNGIGFDEKYLDKIFQPFQRLHGRSSEYEGVGMGLAICRKVVERHGGKIAARSRVDKGSTFIVTLPVNSKAG